MGDYLKGEKLSTTYKQVVCIGAAATRLGIDDTTLADVWTDDGDGSKNLFPYKAASDALQFQGTRRLEFNDDAVYIHSSTDGKLNFVADGETDMVCGSLDINSSGAIDIDGTTVSIDGTGASNFTATGGNLTLSTVTSGEMFLTPVNYIQVASGKKLQFADTGEYVSGNGTDLTIGSGADINLTATADVNIPVNIGLRFGDGGENIETDNTDFTVTSGGKINLTATTDVVIPTNVGLQFTDANEKIESDGTNLTINSGADISLTCATGDVNIPADIGLTFGSDNQKIEGDGTDLAINATGNINVTSTVDEASAVYIRANGGTSETVKIHSDQGTAVTEGAASVSLLSDAGGVELRSTANLANAINLTVDGDTTSSMTLFNDTGTSVTEGSASIQLLSDVGGVGIKSTANLANAILLTADGGTSETIKIHSDRGTGAGSIELTSDAGGIDINCSAAGKTFTVDAGSISLDSTATSNLTMTADTGSTQTLTLSATNTDGGGNVADVVVNADGQVHIKSEVTTNTYAGAGIQIGTDAANVDISIGHTTSNIRVGDDFYVAGDGEIAGDLTVTGTLSSSSTAYTDLTVTDTTPTFIITNSTDEDSALDGTFGSAAGRESRIEFKGDTSGSARHVMAGIVAGHVGTSTDKKGQIQFFVNDGDDGDTALTNVMNIVDTGRVGIGVQAPAATLDVRGTVNVGLDGTGHDVTFFGDTSGKSLLWDESADELALIGASTKLSFFDAAGGENMYASGDGVLLINSGTSLTITTPTLALEGAVVINDTSADVDFRVEGNGDANLIYCDAGNDRVGIGDAAPATKLEINQGAVDTTVFNISSSDVDQAFAVAATADTYFQIAKTANNGGGALIDGFTDSDANNWGALWFRGNLEEAATTGKSEDDHGVIIMQAAVIDGTARALCGTDANLLTIENLNKTRFIFDTEGSFHADTASTTFDSYNDAALVRAFDLSHGKDIITSKFDEFIEYNHEKLAELKLVGRKEDGTPNHFVNVTKMQQLHNGAIWQQYTEMQKMKELMYDTMVEYMGAEKANEKLNKHDITLLDKGMLN